MARGRENAPAVHEQLRRHRHPHCSAAALPEIVDNDAGDLPPFAHTSTIPNIKAACALEARLWHHGGFVGLAGIDDGFELHVGERRHRGLWRGREELNVNRGAVRCLRRHDRRHCRRLHHGLGVRRAHRAPEQLLRHFGRAIRMEDERKRFGVLVRSLLGSGQQGLTFVLRGLVVLRGFSCAFFRGHPRLRRLMCRRERLAVRTNRPRNLSSRQTWGN